MSSENIIEPEKEFLNRLKMILNDNKKNDVEKIRDLLSEWNLFYYTKFPDSNKELCHTNYQDAEYFSKFHRFWEKHHEQILGLGEPNAIIARLIAEKLEIYYNPFSPREVIDTHNLSKEDIANVRLFTTIHDFGFGFTINYFKLAKDNPDLFNSKKIVEKPELVSELARELGVDDYQPDKRWEWCKRCAEWLIMKYDGNAFNIGVRNSYDAEIIKKELEELGIGLADKKIDMFLRDMVAYKVWDLKNFEKISVASDINTMRIALRTGLVPTKIPLLSSFMDVFCYQYMAVDKRTQEGWNKVCNEWGKIPGNHKVESPAQIDFLIFKMGQNCCKTGKRACENQCNEKKQKECIVNKYALKIRCNGWCIFKEICKDERKKLNPPKSISIFGRYGWTTAYSNEGGGLGLRS